MKKVLAHRQYNQDTTLLIAENLSDYIVSSFEIRQYSCIPRLHNQKNFLAMSRRYVKKTTLFSKKHCTLIVLSSIAIFIILSLTACKNSKSSSESYKYALNSSVTYDISFNYSDSQKLKIKSFSLKTENKTQKTDLSENEKFTKKPFYVYDVNFDGYSDILIPFEQSAYAKYFYAYLWDPEKKELVKADNFENLANIAADKEKGLILSSFSGDGITVYSLSKFDQSSVSFNVIRSYSYTRDGDEMIFKKESLENGEMKTVSKFSLPVTDDNAYLSDTEISENIKKLGDTDIDITLFKNYIF